MQTTSLFRMAEPRYPHLGARIRAARAAMPREVTQAEVAGVLDVEPNHFSRIERGYVNPPRKGKEALARFFNLPIDYFVNEPVPALVRVQEDRYPARAAVLKMARDLGYSTLVLEGLAEMRLNAPKDPGLSFWVTQLEALAEMEKHGEPPEDPLPPDAEKGALTKFREKRAKTEIKP